MCHRYVSGAVQGNTDTRTREAVDETEEFGGFGSDDNDTAPGDQGVRGRTNCAGVSVSSN